MPEFVVMLVDRHRLGGPQRVLNLQATKKGPRPVASFTMDKATRFPSLPRASKAANMAGQRILARYRPIIVPEAPTKGAEG